jgi:hypothetical protein
VRLVDGDQGDVLLTDEREERRVGQPLRGGEDDGRLGGGDGRLGGAELVRGDGTVELVRRDAAGAQLVALVLHERDEGRDHQRQPREQQRRELVAEGLAGARRHQRQRRPAGEHVVDRLLLAVAQALQAEGLAKNAADAGPVGRRWLS